MARQHGGAEPGRPAHGTVPAGRTADPADAGVGLLTLVERTLGTGTAVYVPGDGWIRLTLPLDDGGPAPVTVDVIADTRRAPRGIAYLLPGAGLNFGSGFFTPSHLNLAHRLRREGLLVVGVTPREDAATADAIGPGWGLAAHRRDLAAVVEPLDGALGLPYQYAGHGAGALLALDAAAHDDSPRLTRVVALDATGPHSGDLAAAAARTRDAYEARLAEGAYASDPGLAALIARAVTDPAGPSEVPWPPDPGLRFTHAGLAHFALVRTSLLPGPADRIRTDGHVQVHVQGHIQGYAAGSYAFGATPAGDRFGLTHTPLATWRAAAAALGSGLIPTALARDLAAVRAGDEKTYAIDWERISAEVVWINTELGRGDHTRGPRLIRAGGNQRVRFTVVPGYGHGDPVWSDTAAADVWSLI